MKTYDLSAIDRYIARARVVLSLLALASVYVDPVIGGGPFAIDSVALAVLSLHLAYGMAVLYFITRAVVPARFPTICAILDVLFAAAVALVTEGATSPSYVFFCFAIIAVSCREGLRATLRVTAASVLLYLLALLLLYESAGHVFIMRPAYLGLIGCLAAFLGQERAQFEARVRDLEAAAERRSIARSLHDGHVQALAGTNVRLEVCRELLRRGQVAEALDELRALQVSLAREYDGVRMYVRSLAAVATPAIEEEELNVAHTVFQVRAGFTATGALAEQVLQILLEGLRNTLRHSAARSASLHASNDEAAIRIRLDDDGVGFPTRSPAPWSIASRVADLGGSVKIDDSRPGGAHVDIELPGDQS